MSTSLRVPILVLAALLTFYVGLAVYDVFRKRERAVPEERLASQVPLRPTRLPATYPPVYAGDVPGLQAERNWSPTLGSYITLISFALSTSTTCCLPIDPAFLPAILLWYEDKLKEFAIHLRVLHPGSEERMARVIVS